MTGHFQDPYCYPGSPVLINVLNIRDQKKLDEVERTESLFGRVRMSRQEIPDNLGQEYLQQVHRDLFGAVYAWAGELRTVEISKGRSHFHPSSSLQEAFAYTFDWLNNQSDLFDPTISDKAFTRQASQLLADINYIHPFREGNGRAQRAFLDAVASKSGRALAWRKVPTVQHLQASIESFDFGTGKPFESIFTQMMRTAQENPLQIDAGHYLSSAQGTPGAYPLADRWKQNMFGGGQCGASTTSGTPCKRRGRCPYHG